MNKLIALAFVCSCAHHENYAPSWVSGIRSGDEGLKVSSSGKTFYRRLGQTCEKAIELAEQDIERDNQKLVKYTLEVLYNDSRHNDCAVTLSVNRANFEAVVTSDRPDDLEVRNILRQRAVTAIKNAYTGMTYPAFKYLTKDAAPVVVVDYTAPCFQSFRSVKTSIHGTAHICWNNGVVVGYCDTREGNCGTKNP
jgi:hypothetical protein